jgi:hypothetical protein
MRLRPPLFEFFFALCLLILCGQPAIAQPGVAASKAIPAPCATDFGAKPTTPGEGGGLIHLDVVVTDESGKPVTGLGATDLTLFDNGQRFFPFKDSMGFLPSPIHRLRSFFL